MLTAAQISRFQADGYLKGGRVLTDEQVGVLQEEIERVIRDAGTGGGAAEVMSFDCLPTIRVPVSELFAGAPDTTL